jgi:hypothetical protein
MLVGKACSKPPIIIKSHDLHVGDIRGAMGEIVFPPREGLIFSLLWFL